MKHSNCRAKRIRVEQDKLTQETRLTRYRYGHRTPARHRLQDDDLYKMSN